jgi:hypothetical protein
MKKMSDNIELSDMSKETHRLRVGWQRPDNNRHNGGSDQDDGGNDDGDFEITEARPLLITVVIHAGARL